MACLPLLKSKVWFTALIPLLNSMYMLAEYESAGCSDEGCGIPCYMRPAEDPCHYQKHSPCSDEGSGDLEQWVLNLNSSLHRLVNKLIQKGISKSQSIRSILSHVTMIIIPAVTHDTHALSCKVGFLLSLMC